MSLDEQRRTEKQALYTLTISANFCAAHSLRDYPGDCRRLHGHNWRVETEVKAYRLDDIGITIDFKTLKNATRSLAVSALTLWETDTACIRYSEEDR